MVHISGTKINALNESIKQIVKRKHIKNNN